jgi:predicted metalloprotease
VRVLARIVVAAGGLALLASACASSSRSAPPTSIGVSTSTTVPGGIDGSDTSKLPDLPGATTSPNLPDPASGQSFARSGLTYVPSTLQLFSSAVRTGCGLQQSEVGPFYCPADRGVYIDLAFFAALQQQFGLGGFAQAYVVAHEMGHHLQNLLGISSRVAAADQLNPAGAKALSVRVELQADCFAGVWAHTTYTRNLLEPGDIQQALNAAAVVGDDFLQRVQGGQIEPDNWTHGSSAQRQNWFTTGFDTGNPNACDTFSPATP